MCIDDVARERVLENDVHSCHIDISSDMWKGSSHSSSDSRQGWGPSWCWNDFHWGIKEQWIHNQTVWKFPHRWRKLLRSDQPSEWLPFRPLLKPIMTLLSVVKSGHDPRPMNTPKWSKCTWTLVIIRQMNPVYVSAVISHIGWCQCFITQPCKCFMSGEWPLNSDGATRKRLWRVWAPRTGRICVQESCWC